VLGRATADEQQGLPGRSREMPPNMASRQQQDHPGKDQEGEADRTAWVGMVRMAVQTVGRRRPQGVLGNQHPADDHVLVIGRNMTGGHRVDHGAGSLDGGGRRLHPVHDEQPLRTRTRAAAGASARTTAPLNEGTLRHSVE
jgi:hypothetical protein